MSQKPFNICKYCPSVLICKDGFVCTLSNPDLKSKWVIHDQNIETITLPPDCDLKMEHSIVNQPGMLDEN